MNGLNLPLAASARGLAKMFAQLAALVTPPNGQTPEYTPAVFYDTQSYVSGTTTQLNFFSTVGATRNASNMDTAGSFPQPQYFEVHKMFVNLLAPPTYDVVASNVGAMNDVSSLIYGGNAIAQLTVANKGYPEIPLSYCGRSGGPNGVAAATLAAGGKLQLGTQDQIGGFPYNGSIIIPPLTKFGVTINWTAAQTLSGNINVQVGLLGVLYRAVR